MADFPPEVIQRAAEVRYRQYDSEFSAAHLSWQDFAGEAREMLDAVAEALGEHCAAKIAGHALHPRDDGDVPTGWHRHFGIAARVAARAFLSDDDVKRMAAAALARGDYVGRPAPEDDDEPR